MDVIVYFGIIFTILAVINIPDTQQNGIFNAACAALNVIEAALFQADHRFSLPLLIVVLMQ